MRNLLYCTFLSTYGYQIQVAQNDQNDQNPQGNYQHINPHYVPQQGSSGHQLGPPIGPPPRTPLRRKPPPKEEEHNHNNDYRWEISGCHKPVISAQVGFRQFIVSDSFPNVNPSEMFCVWRIKAPIGMIIKLTWRNFHIDNCKVSSIRIFDGFGPVNTPSPNTFCGLLKPEIYHSQVRMLTMVLSTAATGSPLGVQLMIGFEAIVDPMGSVMQNPMLMPVMPLGIGPGGVVSQPGVSNIAGNRLVPTNSGGRLVPIGKYSFTREAATESDESYSAGTGSNDASEEDSEDETNGGLLESVPKKSLTLYIGAGVGGLLVFVFIITKIHSSKKESEDKSEPE